MIISKKVQERINQLFGKFQKGEGSTFPLSETSFQGINIYFEQEPRHLLFLLEDIENTKVYIGSDEDEEVFENTETN